MEEGRLGEDAQEGAWLEKVFRGDMGIGDGAWEWRLAEDMAVEVRGGGDHLV